MYSDNEAVLMSTAMAEIADRFNRTRKSSIEYRPTSNAAAETAFRLVPNEMRKIYVRTGVPPDLFEFVALEAERVLRWTRERADGKTPGEMRTGERADFHKFSRSTFGCKVIARRPVAWRTNKHEHGTSRASTSASFAARPASPSAAT